MSAEAKNAVKQNTYYCRSYANVDLGVFLIFFGIIGATPLYGMFANIVLRQAEIEWRIGFGLGILCLLAGHCLIRYSRRRFRVRVNPDGSGTISIREGVFKHALIYQYAPGSKIKLSAANTEEGEKKSLTHITLVDGNRYYLLDSRNASNLNESRFIAEFLSKHSGLNLWLTHFDNLELTPADLDLSFKAIHEKYPILMGSPVERPQTCHVKVTPLNNGKDRRYSWGIRSNGRIGQYLSYFTMVLLLSLLPLFETNQQLCSAVNWILITKNYPIFYEFAAASIIVFLIAAGYGTEVRIEGLRVNIARTFWGMTYKKYTMLLDDIAGIFTKNTSSATYLLFLDEKDTIKLRVASSPLANYLASDMRFFIAGR